MKTLYIHIGMPKTGTTSLQDFLHINEAALFQQGFIFRPMPFHCYRWENPELEKTGLPRFNSHSARVTSPNRNGIFLRGSFMEKYRERDQKLLSEGFALLLRWFEEKDNVLLTDEVLWRTFDRWPETVSRFARDHEIRVRIVVYLRRQAEYLDSIYRQDVKLLLVKLGFFDYIGNRDFSEAHLGADYAKRLNLLAERFGREYIIVRSYRPKAWAAEN